MDRMEWIKENELLTNKHLFVKYVIDGLSESFFEHGIKSLASGYGFATDAGGCCIWESLDEASQSQIQRFEGVEFEIPLPDSSTVLSYKDTLSYMCVACKNYCMRHPEAKERLNKYLNQFAKLNGLSC